MQKYSQNKKYNRKENGINFRNEQVKKKNFNLQSLLI